MPQLYRAHSIMDDYHRDSDITVNWVCCGREYPVAPCWALIGNYHVLDSPSRRRAQEYVSELFTRDEIDDLETYLDEHHGLSVTVEEVELPMFGHLEPHGPLPRDGETDAWTLSEEDSYYLPFETRGFRHQTECRRRIDLVHDQRRGCECLGEVIFECYAENLLMRGRGLPSLESTGLVADVASMRRRPGYGLVPSGVESSDDTSWRQGRV